jgi:hypothetical protein
MKQKMKPYFKRGLLGLVIFSLFYQCQKVDDAQALNEESEFSLNISIVTINEHFAKTNPIVYGKIQQTNKKNVLSRETQYSSDYDFHFNLDRVQIIEKDTYTQYTIVVENESDDDSLLNYVLIIYNDGEEYQYLVNYPRVETSNGLEIDHSNATLQSLDGTSLLARGAGPIDCPDGTPELVGVTQEYGCTAIGCTGSNNHDAGEDCECGTVYDCEPPSNDCGWSSVNVWSCTGGGGSGIGDNGGATGGGTSNGEGNNNNNGITTVALVEIDRTARRECRKINNFLDDPDHADFKQNLIDLASPSNYAQNLDIEFEKATTSHEDSSELVNTEGNDGLASADITYTLTHPTNTEAFVHTHPNDAIGTYSVFSFEDLIGISNILAHDKLDTGTFVAYLITKKDNDLTYYALTINDKTKFKDFFSTYNDSDYNYLTATQEEKDNRTESRRKTNVLRKKYYDDTTNPLISDNNPSRELMLFQFLKFMEEADMGTTIFKTDENFNNFTKVSV